MFKKELKICRYDFDLKTNGLYISMSLSKYLFERHLKIGIYTTILL